MLRLIAFALVPLALLTGTAAAGKGGPSPGVITGWDGTVDVSSAVRYVALPSASATTVAAVRTSDGRVLRYTTIRGTFGIPLVAFDGTTEGISRDGKTLVLADVGVNQSETRFAVLGTATLRLKKSVTLPGYWAYDALSPNGRTLYATQYLGTGANPRYNVRAVSLVTGKPIGGAIVDRREPDEEMNGSPWARAERQRRLGLHAVCEAQRHRVRPRARHHQAARILRRPAVALEPPAARCGAPLARGRRPLARAGQARREPARNRRHGDLQGDSVREAVATRRWDRLRSPSRSPRRLPRCRGWR